MDLFNLFSSKQVKLRKRAEILVPSAKIAGISVYTSLLERFPSFNSISTKDWDFFFPIASIYVATIGMEKIEISNELKSELSVIYGKALDDWSSDWNRVFKDCGEFFWRTVEGLQSSNDPDYIQSPKYRISDSIGSWLVWNLLGRSPESEDERKLVRTIGILVTEEFVNWWT